MRIRKIIFSLGFFIAGIIVISALWKQVFVLSIVLVALALLKRRFLPIKQELLWFIIIGLIGSVGENIIIFSGVWSYAEPQIINVPIWLALAWGLFGTTAITLYESISGSK